jgi:hypothetical protein
MPVMHLQAPLLQVCPVPQVKVAHGSVVGLPAMLLMAPAAELPAPEVEGEPPAEKLMPPLPTELPPLDEIEPLPLDATEPLPLDATEPLPLDATEPPDGCEGAPLELIVLPPVLGESPVPPELQATKQSNETAEKSWGPCLDQE